eukprot:augustus_masked-scaffold_22-processed-gene-1.42-mRNA-1 protein AED:1.00 eAED:1.00 QI:0/-1/0/0/-1/1/1/0/1791
MKKWRLFGKKKKKKNNTPPTSETPEGSTQPSPSAQAASDNPSEANQQNTGSLAGNPKPVDQLFQPETVENEPEIQKQHSLISLHSEASYTENLEEPKDFSSFPFASFEKKIFQNIVSFLSVKEQVSLTEVSKELRLKLREFPLDLVSVAKPFFLSAFQEIVKPVDFYIGEKGPQWKIKSVVSGLSETRELSKNMHASSLEHLIIVNTKFKSLEGVEAFSSLERIEFHGCPELKDLGPLQKITNLKTLLFTQCILLDDLSPISNLTKLETVFILSCPAIQNISPMENLINLDTLVIKNCFAVEEFSALKSLKKLELFDATGTRIKNLDFLHKDVKLKRCILEVCGSLENINGLSGKVSELRVFKASGVNSLDFGPLNNSKQLILLSLEGFNIRNLDFLAKSPMLTDLNISKCEDLADLSAIEKSGAQKQLMKIACSDCPKLDENAAKVVISCEKMLDVELYNTSARFTTYTLLHASLVVRNMLIKRLTDIYLAPKGRVLTAPSELFTQMFTIVKNESKWKVQERALSLTMQLCSNNPALSVGLGGSEAAFAALFFLLSSDVYSKSTKKTALELIVLASRAPDYVPRFLALNERLATLLRMYQEDNQDEDLFLLISDVLGRTFEKFTNTLNSLNVQREQDQNVGVLLTIFCKLYVKDATVKIILQEIQPGVSKRRRSAAFRFFNKLLSYANKFYDANSGADHDIDKSLLAEALEICLTVPKQRTEGWMDVESSFLIDKLYHAMKAESIKQIKETKSLHFIIEELLNEAKPQALASKVDNQGEMILETMKILMAARDLILKLPEELLEDFFRTSALESFMHQLTSSAEFMAQLAAALEEIMIGRPDDVEEKIKMFGIICMLSTEAFLHLGSNLNQVDRIVKKIPKLASKFGAILSEIPRLKGSLDVFLRGLSVIVVFAKASSAFKLDLQKYFCDQNVTVSLNFYFKASTVREKLLAGELMKDLLESPKYREKVLTLEGGNLKVLKEQVKNTVLEATVEKDEDLTKIILSCGEVFLPLLNHELSKKTWELGRYVLETLFLDLFTVLSKLTNNELYLEEKENIEKRDQTNSSAMTPLANMLLGGLFPGLNFSQILTNSSADETPEQKDAREKKQAAEATERVSKTVSRTLLFLEFILRDTNSTILLDLFNPTVINGILSQCYVGILQKKTPTSFRAMKMICHLAFKRSFFATNPPNEIILKDTVSSVNTKKQSENLLTIKFKNDERKRRSLEKLAKTLILGRKPSERAIKKKKAPSAAKTAAKYQNHFEALWRYLDNDPRSSYKTFLDHLLENDFIDELICLCFAAFHKCGDDFITTLEEKRIFSKFEPESLSKLRDSKLLVSFLDAFCANKDFLKTNFFIKATKFLSGARLNQLDGFKRILEVYTMCLDNDKLLPFLVETEVHKAARKAVILIHSYGISNLDFLKFFTFVFVFINKLVEKQPQLITEIVTGAVGRQFVQIQVSQLQSNTENYSAVLDFMKTLLSELDSHSLQECANSYVMNGIQTLLFTNEDKINDTVEVALRLKVASTINSRNEKEKEELKPVALRVMSNVLQDVNTHLCALLNSLYWVFDEKLDQVARNNFGQQGLFGEALKAEDSTLNSSDLAFQRASGLPHQVEVIDGLDIDFAESVCSCVSTQALKKSSDDDLFVYFELLIQHLQEGGNLWIGFVDDSLKKGFFEGDLERNLSTEENTCGVDVDGFGLVPPKHQNGKVLARSGDSLGVCLSMKNGEVKFYLNGDEVGSSEPNKGLFADLQNPRIAISGRNASVSFNFGIDPFSFTLSEHEVLSYQEFVEI